MITANYSGMQVAGKYVEVVGELRTYNEFGKDGKSHLHIVLFVKTMCIYETKEDVEGITADANLIQLNGTICKPPVFRTTPLGREITNFILAVNRAYRESSYLPCICWGRTARYVVGWLEVGTRVDLYGRIQSRPYFKRISPDSEEGETKEAYEISVRHIKPIGHI